MKNILYKVLFGVLFCLSTEAVFSQTVATTKKDGLIVAKIKDVSAPMFNVNGQSVDANRLMSSFDIQIYWWALLSEPVEKYNFTWYSTGKFVFGDKTITKQMLRKYPDLLKRFNNLTPYKVWVFIEGFKKPLFSSASTSTPDFIYLIDHLKILQSKSGDKGDGIVGGSPHWNEFLDWGDNVDNQIDGITKLSRREYQKGSKSNQSFLKQNKSNFSDLNKVTLKASLYKVEWHENELKGIAETYDKYESGELKPEESSDELNDLLSGGGGEECGDDLNAMLSGCGEEKVIEFDITRRDGKEGVVAKDGRVLIPFKDWDITNYDSKTGLAQIIKNVGTRSKSGFCDKTFNVEIKELSTVDGSGKAVLPAQLFAEYPTVAFDISNAITLGTRRVNETAAERRARERRKAERERERREAEERARRCDEQNEPVLKAFKKELKAQSINVSKL